MFITCDSIVKMAYIYLQKPKENSHIWNKESGWNLERYLEGKIPKISMESTGEDIQQRLNSINVSSTTYLEDLENNFEEEYLNDKCDGYISGIELNFSKEEFISNIKNRVYEIFELEWKEKIFLLLILDELDKVLDNNNIIYPANTNNDVFYIVAIEDDIVYIKAILSSREDLYEREYLTKPSFILYE